MGNVCQNQRDQDTFQNREKNPKKLQTTMNRNLNNDLTQSDIKEFNTDFNGDISQIQQVLYMSSEFQKKDQQKISMNDFKLEKVLGKGSFGKVMLVKHLHEDIDIVSNEIDKYYAMKILQKKSIKNERQKRHTMTERWILEKIDHPFIVKLHYAFQTKQKLYLVLDFMVGGELFHHLKKSGKFSEEITRYYAAQIVLGIEHLHELKIIYRDLKPENILLDAEGNVKLADFGLSKMDVDHDAPAHSLCGTPEYLAPEIITSKNGHDKTVDWWSFGALIYEMLNGSPPFYSNNKKQMLQNIIYKPIPIPKSLSEKSKSLLQSLLVVNPNFRLGFGPEGTQNVKNHPFFESVDWDLLKQKKIKTPLNINVSNNLDTKYFDPYLLKQQPMDTPASYNQDLFKFSQFTYNKKIEEFQMEEFQDNEQNQDDSNELYDLNGIDDNKNKNKIEQNIHHKDISSQISEKKLDEVEKMISQQKLSSEYQSITLKSETQNEDYSDQNPEESEQRQQAAVSRIQTFKNLDYSEKKTQYNSLQSDKNTIYFEESQSSQEINNQEQQNNHDLN